MLDKKTLNCLIDYKIRIKKLIWLKKMTRKDLLKYMMISAPSLSAKLNGSRAFKDYEITLLEDYLKQKESHE